MSHDTDAGADRVPLRKSDQYQRVNSRTLHLIDVENLVGGEINTSMVRRALRTYGPKIKRDGRDTVVVAIAVTHRNILSTLADQVRFRFFPVLGHAEKNGADEALVNTLEILRHRAPLRRDYGQIVFASGDRCFVEPAKKQADEGVSVVNVTGLGGRSTSWTVHITVEHRQLTISRPAARSNPTDGPAQSALANSHPALNLPESVPLVVLDLRAHEKALPAVSTQEIRQLLSAVTDALSDQNWNDLGLDAADGHQRVIRLGKRARKIAHDNGGSVATNHSNYILAALNEAEVLKPGATYDQLSEPFASYLLRRAADLGCVADPEKDRHAVEEWLKPD